MHLTVCSLRRLLYKQDGFSLTCFQIAAEFCECGFRIRKIIFSTGTVFDITRFFPVICCRKEVLPFRSRNFS